MRQVIGKIVDGGRAIGPYVAIELILPGGSLIAALVWIYRNRPKRFA